jgi:hypothetical protein
MITSFLPFTTSVGCLIPACVNAGWPTIATIRRRTHTHRVRIHLDSLRCCYTPTQLPVQRQSPESKDRSRLV